MLQNLSREIAGETQRRGKEAWGLQSECAFPRRSADGGKQLPGTDTGQAWLKTKDEGVKKLDSGRSQLSKGRRRRAKCGRMGQLRRMRLGASGWVGIARSRWGSFKGDGRRHGTNDSDDNDQNHADRTTTVLWGDETGAEHTDSERGVQRETSERTGDGVRLRMEVSEAGQVAANRQAAAPTVSFSKSWRGTDPLAALPEFQRQRRPWLCSRCHASLFLAVSTRPYAPLVAGGEAPCMGVETSGRAIWLPWLTTE
ncbi:hypothetical protein FQN55_000110 [Onygenales sp. PD_40]|nr:hypothetical protein FQN55_000110 [Onygenales sp. PD_40]